MGKIIPISSHIKYRARPVDLPASFAVAKDALGLEEPVTPIGFYFSRRKAGTEIWLKFSNRFSLNLSVQNNVWPKSFKEARVWATEYSNRHGFKFSESKSRRF